MSEEDVQNNVGEENTIPEVEEDLGEVPSEPGTDSISDPKGLKGYKKLDFNVVDIKKQVPDIPKPENEEDKPVESIFTKEEARFFSQMMWAMPESILGSHMALDQKLVNQWGDQLFVYCEKKGINLGEYLMDEFGLIMSTGLIVGSLASKYNKHKKELKDAEQTKLETGV